MKLWLMLQRRRWPLLAVALVLLAGYWLMVGGPATDQAATPAGVAMAPGRPPVAGDEPEPNVYPQEYIRQESAINPSVSPVDIFAVRNWAPPAPVEAPVAAAPPPPPQAPPLPFRYAGKLEEPGKAPIIFLTQGEQMLAVSPGDLINGKYRVGKLQGGQLHFLYQPMKIQQSLTVGGDT